MERREELNTKARDLERRGAVDAALQIYLGLVGDSSEAVPGALWVQVGSLQRKLGQVSSAQDSYSRAVASFTEAGHFNNALAVCFFRQAMDPDSPGAYLNAAELALAHGYREFARSAVASYARLMSAADRADAAIGPIAAFVNRYPDERSLWQEWVADLLDRGRQPEAVEVLEGLRAILVEGGNQEESSRVGLELLRLRPSARPSDEPLTESWESSVQPGQPDEAVIDIAEVVPLLGDTHDAEDDFPYDSIAPLPGLELTDIGSRWEPAGVDEIGQLLDISHDVDLTGVADSVLDELDELDGFDEYVELDEDREMDDLEPLVFLNPYSVDSHLDSQTVDSEPDWSLAPSDFSSAEEVVPDAPPAYPGPSNIGSTAPDTETMDVAWIVAELLRLATKDVDDVDSHTHFDLGVAFKEMGLWEESLANLASAMSGGHDPIASLEVVGEILVDRAENDLARRLLGGVPGVGSTDSPQLAGIHYWLGRAAERVGTAADARQLFQLVVDVHPNFMDAEQRLLRLSQGPF